MTAAITTLRSTIAAALTSSDWATSAYPLATVLANSVTVAPADPYITPSNNSYSTISPMANFKIIMVVPLFDNHANFIGIENMAVAVFNLLAASSIVFNVSAVSAPSVLEVASGNLLTADITINVLTEWS